jgi:hypothetical protein
MNKSSMYSDPLLLHLNHNLVGLVRFGGVGKRTNVEGLIAMHVGGRWQKCWKGKGKKRKKIKGKGKGTESEFGGVPKMAISR